MPSSIQEPLINKNKSLQDYYHSLESRIGYRLVLGGTRHFGFYTPGTYWPFPIGRALRAMEDDLIARLSLEAGSKILDAGCGVAHVAIHLAQKGYHVEGIDVVDHHIVKARQNVKAAGLEGIVTISKGDYHHLDAFADGSLDGAFTMETFVHATEPEVAIAGILSRSAPWGLLAMYEYEHVDYRTQSSVSSTSWQTINKHAAMPASDRFTQGVLRGMLEDAGFENVVVKDLSENVLPMLRFFFLLAFIPYHIICFLGLKSTFVNTVAGYEGYVYRDATKYVGVSAKKPLSASPQKGSY